MNRGMPSGAAEGQAAGAGAAVGDILGKHPCCDKRSSAFNPLESTQKETRVNTKAVQKRSPLFALVL